MNPNSEIQMNTISNQQLMNQQQDVNCKQQDIMSITAIQYQSQSIQPIVGIDQPQAVQPVQSFQPLEEQKQVIQQPIQEDSSETEKNGYHLLSIIGFTVMVFGLVFSFSTFYLGWIVSGIGCFLILIQYKKALKGIRIGCWSICLCEIACFLIVTVLAIIFFAYDFIILLFNTIIY